VGIIIWVLGKCSKLVAYNGEDYSSVMATVDPMYLLVQYVFCFRLNTAPYALSTQLWSRHAIVSHG